MCLEKELPRDRLETLCSVKQRKKKDFCSQISEEDYFDLYCSKFHLNGENRNSKTIKNCLICNLYRPSCDPVPPLSLQTLCLTLHYGKVDNLSHLLGASILRGKSWSLFHTEAVRILTPHLMRAGPGVPRTRQPQRSNNFSILH